jgi:DNA-binding Lrp family transcriptional regulator
MVSGWLNHRPWRRGYQTSWWAAAGGGSPGGNVWKPKIFRRTVAAGGAGARTPTAVPGSTQSFDVPALAPVVCDADQKGDSGMVSAYVLVSVEAGKNQEVVAALRSMDAVKQAHACWGQPDIFAFVEVADEPTLAEVVLTAIQGLPGIRTTETYIVAPV